MILIASIAIAGCGGGGGGSSGSGSGSTPSLVSIEISPTNPNIGLGTTQRFTATGIYSDSSIQTLTSRVTWSSSNNSVATINTLGLATSVSSGTTSITATLGNVSENTTLTVNAGAPVLIAVTPTNPTIAKGTTLQFTATATYADQTTQDVTESVVWGSSNSTTAILSNQSGSNGLATAVAAGSANIRATLGTITGSTLLTVTPATLSSMTVTPTNPSIAKGTTKQFTATGTFSDNSTQNMSTQVAWISSNGTVATLNSTGLATSLAAGATTITAALGSVSGNTTLTVTAATLASIAVTPTNPSIVVLTTKQFTATGTFSDSSTQNLTTQVAWSSANTAVGTVSNTAGSNGLATSTGTGSTTITATLSGLSGSTALTVTAATLVSIAVTPANPSIVKGTKQSFTATGTYSNSTTQNLTASVTWNSSATSKATVSNASGTNGQASSVGVGSTTITATLGLISGNTILTVTSATLSFISVSPTNPTIANGTAIQFTATGTYSDNTTQNLSTSVTWDSSDMTMATISNAGGSEGFATSVAAGPTTITATLSGVSGYTTLTVTSATLAMIDITPSNSSIANGTTIQFTAIGTFSDASTQILTAQVTWGSSDITKAAISNASGSEGLATSVGAGPTTITATLGVSGNTTLTVTSATLSTLNVTPTNPTIANGTNQLFTAIGSYSDGSTQDLTAAVTWSSSATSKATISNAFGSEGLANSVAAGGTTITALDPISFISGSTTLTVTSATLSSMDVTPTHPSIANGTTLPFTAIGSFSDGTTEDLTTQAAWSSSDNAIAVISGASGSEGLATSGGAGTATITAAVGYVSGGTTLTVTSATLSAIEVTPTNPSIANGTKQPFNAIGTFSDGSTEDLTTQVTWSSDTTAVGVISNASGSGGLASSVSAGTATISAAMSGVAGSTTLTVTAATLSSIDVTPTDPGLALGTKLQLTATGTYSDNTTQDLTTAVTWSSSDPSKATISNASGTNGLASSIAAGPTTITAGWGGVSGSTTLTVTSATLTSIDLTPDESTIANGTKLQFAAIGNFSDGTTQDLTTLVAWGSSNAAVATISNSTLTKGLATSVAAGSATIAATFGGILGNTTLTVTSATLNSIAVTPASPSIANGTKLQLTATGTYSDTSTQDLTTQVTWSSSDMAKASVSNSTGTNGLLTSISTGPTTITAALGIISGYTTLTVTSATISSIAVTPASPSIAIGTKLQFTATGTFSDASTQDLTTQVTWSSSSSGIAAISNAAKTKGQATSVAAGSTTITAVFGSISGNTMLTVKSASVVLSSIAVTPFNPTLTKGTKQQFTATGHYSDASTQDLTSQVTWSSSSNSNLTISNSSSTKGLATIKKSGLAVVTATLGAKSGTSTVTIP